MPMEPISPFTVHGVWILEPFWWMVGAGVTRIRSWLRGFVEMLIQPSLPCNLRVSVPLLVVPPAHRLANARVAWTLQLFSLRGIAHAHIKTNHSTHRGFVFSAWQLSVQCARVDNTIHTNANNVPTQKLKI